MGVCGYKLRMKNTLDKLPEDVAILHKMIGDLSSKNSSLTKTNSSLSQEISSLKFQLKLLRRKQFGKTSEKQKEYADQLELWIEEKETANPSQTEELEEASSAKQSKTEEAKNKPKRKPLPEHLPREDQILNPEPKCPECGGEEFRKIADDISETLEYKPASFKVIRHIRPRCVCVNCEKIVQADSPDKTIAKGKAGSGLLAHILIQKYCNHLPLYRQSEIYAREGVELSRSTMAGWAGRCARLLDPLINELKKSIFASSEIHGDDTPIRVLAPGIGKTKTGRLWAYVRDGRPHDSDLPPAVCYFYSPDRKGERPAEHLKNFTGTLHADAYAGFDRLYAKDVNGVTSIIEAACWAHTRRKFFEITVGIPNAGIACEAVSKIDRLYEIERAVRGESPEVRLEHRQKHARAVVDEFFIWLKQQQKKLPKASDTVKAINYAMKLEQALSCYLKDGKIEIDNNAAERAMRCIALGRKNYLFAGSDDGGETAAAIYSLIETAKLNNLNPWQYLNKVLATIQNHNSQKLAELLPWNLKLE